jgi:hypothetical protein
MLRRISLGLLAVNLCVQAQSAFPLVENGHAQAQVTGGDAEAAAELIHYIEKVTDARLPSTGNLPARILVGPSVCPAVVRDRLRGLGSDGYIIMTLPGNVLALAGNGHDGTAFAVDTFLERYAGVRWLWPGELGEVLPHTTTLRVPSIAVSEQPAFVWRDLGPRGALWGPLDKWEKERELGVSVKHQHEQALWARRNRFGGISVHGGHAFGAILPPAKYARTHPEYYALVNGKRAEGWERFDGKHGMQPCTTNPDVIRLTVEYCLRLFREHPEYDAVSISPNDGRGFCECDRCRRLDTGPVLEDKRGRQSPSISDRMITFVNQVADGVRKTAPGKKVLVFAYGAYHSPPAREKANDSAILQYTFKAASLWDKEAVKEADADLTGWARMVRNPGIYEYFTQSNFPDMPRLYPELIERSVKQLRQLGYRYYQTQAGDGYALNGLNFYVLARLLWDPGQNADAIVSDYVDKGFGKAAPAVRRYFDRLRAAWRDTGDVEVKMLSAGVQEYRAVQKLYPKSLLAACRADLAEAESLAEGRDRDRVHFLQAGFHYLDLTMDAIDKTLPLAESG